MVRLVALSLAFFLFSNSSYAATVFTLESSPDSYIGGGLTVYASQDNQYEFITSEYGSNLVFHIATSNSPYGSNFDPLSNEPYDYWRLEIAPPGTESFATQRYYAPPNYDYYSAQLDFSGNHRGASGTYGYFDILDIAFNGDGSLNRIAVDFFQNEGLSQWTRGSLRINSDVAIVPVPAAFWLFLSALPLLLRLRRN